MPAQATPCSTRTTFPTTTPKETVSQPAVIFGGPSPEHDVSIILGLPARAGARRRRPRRRPPSTGRRPAEFVAVDLRSRRRTSSTACPARPGRSCSAPAGSRARRRRRPRSSSTAATAGPARTARCRRRSTLPASPTPARRVAGAALGHGQAGVRRRRAVGRAAVAARALLTSSGRAPAFDGPYIVKPRFGGSSIGIELAERLGHGQAPGCSSSCTCAPALSSSPTGRSRRTSTSPCAPTLSCSCRPSSVRCAAPAGQSILGYADKYLGGEGMVQRARELPADIPADIEKQLRDVGCGGRESASACGAWPASTSCYDGGELFVNEINTIPGSTGEVPLDRPGDSVHAAAAGHD